MTKDELRKLAMGASAPIQKIPQGQSNNISTREWHDIVRSPTRFNPIQAAKDAESEYEQLCEIRHEMAHDAAFVGDMEYASELMSGQHDDMIRRKIRGQ